MKIKLWIVGIMFLTVLGNLAALPQTATPMSKDQIMSVVTAGMDNAELAKKIEERGIDFDLTDDYLQALRKAGAQDVVIQALRTVKPSPMSRDQLLLLVSGGVPSERAAALVKQRGIDFMPDEKLLENLRTAGADDALVAVVREAKPPEVQRHLVRAAECEQKHTWAEAEKEYRAALALAPGNAEILQKAEAAAKHQIPPQYKLVRTFEHPGRDLSYPCGTPSQAISPDGRFAAWRDCSSGFDVWEVATGQQWSSLSATGATSPFAFSPDARWLAAQANEYFGLWDVATGRQIWKVELRVVSIAFSPDGRLLSAAERDGNGTVKVWEASSGRAVCTVTAHAAAKPMDAGSENMRPIAFGPNGQWLASGNPNNTIELWEAATGREVYTLTGHTKGPDDVAVSPDGRWLASTGDVIKIWDLATGKEARSFDSKDYIVAFTAGGDWLASASNVTAGTGITLWETATGRKASNFAGDIDGGYYRGIFSLSFSADGKWLAAARGAKVYLWQRQD